MQINRRIAAAVLLSRIAAAQISFCAPGTSNVCFQVGIPAAAQAAGSGDMYFQITAPTSYAWVALGEGTAMAGANIFVLYQDGAGGVTISPRSGLGYVQPMYNPQGAQLTLLAGSGIINNQMVANVLCSNCNSWSGGTANFGGITGFVSAWLSGSFASASVSADLNQHDNQAVFTANLAGSTIPSDTNPFVLISNSSSTQIPPGSIPPDPTTSASTIPAPTASSIVVTVSNAPEQPAHAIHGVIMAVVFLALYPTGSFLMPFLGRWMLHASWQMFAFVAMWVGFYFGYSVAQDFGVLFKQPHTIIGVVVCSMMALQPIFGWLHHKHFVKQQTRSFMSYVHIFLGRGLMVLGIVNGGLGLQLAKQSVGLITGYLIVAVIISLLYASGPLIKRYRWLHSPRKAELSPSSTPLPFVSPENNRSNPYEYAGPEEYDTSQPMRFHGNDAPYPPSRSDVSTATFPHRPENRVYQTSVSSRSSPRHNR